jgi:hypothetical protein
MLISKQKKFTQDNEGWNILNKGSIHQQDIVLSVYLPDNRPLKYMMQKFTELKESREMHYYN